MKCVIGFDKKLDFKLLKLELTEVNLLLLAVNLETASYLFSFGKNIIEGLKAALVGHFSLSSKYFKYLA